MKSAYKPHIYMLHGVWRVARSLGDNEAAWRFVWLLNRKLPA